MINLLKWIKDNQAVAAALVPFVCTGIFAALSATKEGYDAWFVAGVPWGQSSQAIEQRGLWERNGECFRSTEPTRITNKYDVEISTVICPSGDVLISAQAPTDKHPSYKWVSWGNVADTITMNVSLFSEAHASQVIIKKYYNGDGTCSVREIDPYTGQVVREYEVKC